MPVAEEVGMASGGKQGAKVGAFGLMALIAALVGPGVATVSAQPATVVASTVEPATVAQAIETVKVEEAAPAAPKT